MSRIGKKPIIVPDKVNVTINNKEIVVKGEKGTLYRTISDEVGIELDENAIRILIDNESKKKRAMQGLTRSLIANMVKGVSVGFEKSLEINGIGYRAEIKGNAIVLNLGYSHPINFELPKGVSAGIEKNVIKLSSIDNETLGQTAASIRKLRPPEPYKGKGVKYVDEYIQRKAGKAGA